MDNRTHDGKGVNGATFDNIQRSSLAQLRKLAKVTQEDLARILNTSQTQVARIEKRGPYRGPSSTLRSYVERGLGYQLLYVVRHGQTVYIIA